MTHPGPTCPTSSPPPGNPALPSPTRSRLASSAAGLARTTAAKALGAAIEADPRRIQFTPDLLLGIGGGLVVSRGLVGRVEAMNEAVLRIVQDVEADVRVVGHAHMLAHAPSNLLEDAGRVDVMVSLREADDGSVRLAVRDEAPGIPAADRSRVLQHDWPVVGPPS